MKPEISLGFLIKGVYLNWKHLKYFIHNKQSEMKETSVFYAEKRF